MSSVVERFMRYVKVNTRSDETSSNHPSTDVQFTLSKIMAEELQRLGMEDVTIDQYGIVTATFPSNLDHPVPVMGLFAHLDTSGAMSGENVNPRIVENYDGGDIPLDPENGVILSPHDFPELKKYIGKTLITTDGKDPAWSR